MTDVVQRSPVPFMMSKRDARVVSVTRNCCYAPNEGLGAGTEFVEVVRAVLLARSGWHTRANLIRNRRKREGATIQAHESAWLVTGFRTRVGWMVVQTILLQQTVERAPTDSQPTSSLFLVPSSGFIGSKDLFSLKRTEGSGKCAPVLADLARSLSNLERQMVERQDGMGG